MSGQVPDSNKGNTRFSDMMRNAQIALKKSLKNFTQELSKPTLKYNVGTGKRAKPIKYPKQSFPIPPAYPNYGQFYFHKKPTGREVVKR